MFNHKIKEEFVAQLNYDEASIKRTLTLFKKIEPVEKLHETDICNLNPATYPEHICKIIKPNKFSYFETAFYTLMLYREFCYRKGYVDLVKYHTNDSGLIGIYKSQGKLFSWLHECFSSYVKRAGNYFYDIDTLLEHLENFYDEIDNLKFEDNNIKIKSPNIVRYSKMIILYLSLLYFGIPKDKVSLIKKSDIEFNKKITNAVIKLDNSVYHINGRAVKILYSVKEAIYAQCQTKGPKMALENSQGFRAIPLHDVYLLCYETDDSDELIQKRSKKYYNNYCKDCGKYDDLDLDIPPASVKTIVFQGEINRMTTLYNKLQKDNYHLHGAEDILELYQKVTNKTPKNYLLKYEIVETFKDHVNYLNNYCTIE